MVNHKSLLANFSLMVSLLVGVVLASTVFAVGEDNVGGFGYAKNIGWISFNDDSIDGSAEPNVDGLGDGGTYDYGVGIDDNGVMSGYAWSADTLNTGAKEGIGWISFNADDVDDCSGCSGVCTPTVDPNADASDNHAVTGWARAISAVEAGSNAGGWDGCLKFKTNSYIDSNGDFHGWMTSSEDTALDAGVIGLVNLNSANCDGTTYVCTENASYKVHTGVSFGPEAKMECGGGSCSPGGYCDIDPGSTWVMFAPTGDCPNCDFSVTNTSTPEDSIKCTNWKLVGTDYAGTYDGRQNLTFLPSVPTGTYTLKLTVSSTPKADNNDECSLGSHSSVEHLISIKENTNVDYMCTLDDPAAEGADPVWFDCDSDSFKKKVLKDERIYMSDDPALTKHSVASEIGSEIDVDTRLWTVDIDGSPESGSGSEMSFKAGDSNIIKLEASDDAGRQNCQIINFNSKRIPKWQEVNPVSMILNGMLASLSGLFRVK